MQRFSYDQIRPPWSGMGNNSVPPHVDSLKNHTRKRGLLNELETLFFEFAADPMFITDVETLRIIDANQAACDLYGYSRDELLKMGPKDLNPPYEREKLSERINKLINDRQVRSRATHVDRDGKFINVELNCRLIEYLGKTYTLTIIRDISESKLIEEALQQHERQLAEAQSIARIGSWEHNLETGRPAWSTELYRIYGISPENFTPTLDSFISIIHPDDRAAMQGWIADCLAGQKPRALEFRVVWPDGTIRYIEGQGKLILDAGGKPVYMCGTAQDITERTQVKQMLAESMRKLEEKELAKSRFLAAAGHDLRQPLTAANLFVGALKSTELTPRQRSIIGHLEQAMDNFNELLNALLNVSKLDAGVIKPEYTSISVSELLNWLRHSFSQLAQDKRLDFDVYFPIKKLLYVRGDTSLLKTALTNLVSNAIKFTARGGILVSARPRGDSVLFQVWDSGVGIPAHAIDRVFDEFFQLDNPQRDVAKGMGLGLFIARRALSLFDGKLTCRSKVGAGSGSVFEFRLPIADPAARSSHFNKAEIPTENAGLTAYARGKRFVVVEDDRMIAEAFCLSLRAMGADVSCFASAEDALLRPDIDDADCYIVDYRLAGKFNGVQFLSQISKSNDRTLTAVLITGDTSPDFIRAAENCDWPILYKPVVLHKILARLIELDGCSV
jgi:PAS domain S-box-containing protein